MPNETKHVRVQPNQIAEATNTAQRDGWTLVDTRTEDDGYLILIFERAERLRAHSPNTATVYGSQSAKPIDPNVAWLELIGLIGFLGIGYLVAGRTNEGVMRLVGFFFLSFVGWLITIALMGLVIGCCLVPVMLAFQIGVPVWSALTLKASLEK